MTHDPEQPELNTAAAQIDARIAELNDWRGEAISHVRALIQAADPDVMETIKWAKPSNSISGVPVWEHAGIICTGEHYKDKVKFTFAKGASIPDPSKIFNSSLDGNARRALDLFQGDRVDEAAFIELIRQAVRLNLEKKAPKK